MDKKTSTEQTHAVNCLKLIQQYAWLLNSFVLDFYTDDHWGTLPSSWRHVLDKISLEELGCWMSMTERTTQRVWPLSLIALRASAKAHSLTREPTYCTEKTMPVNKNVTQTYESSRKPGVETECLTHKNLKNLFVRHVKPKKRHETVAMAKLCADAAVKSGINCVVDIGGGKGHLSRLLAYGYGLNVICVEAQRNLISSAREIDQQMQYTASKCLGNSYVSSLPNPEYIEMTIGYGYEALNQFKMELLSKLNLQCEDNLSFGIVGLHPCGNLAATLLQLFTNLKEAKFICIASCCYMKLSVKKCEEFCGYPLSNFFQNLPESLTQLTYEQLEVSCHALEAYCQRLQRQQYSLLKIHCFRAVLEKLIIKHRPDRKHSGLRSVRHFDEMDFPAYAARALDRTDVTIPMSDLENEETSEQLEKWQNVVILYSLRLLLAPLVESAVLLDRLLFVLEQGDNCCIIPGFDPVVSPRNLILQGSKT